MQALLLLAGRSKRFWPLHDKSLFPICGKTLLEHQLARLADAGITDVTLVGGAHNLDEVRTRFPKFKVIEQEKLELGMRGALQSALPQMKNEPVLVVSGNDVVSPDAYKDVTAAAKKCDGAILARRVKTYFPGGYLESTGDRLTGIVEKPGEGNEPSDLVNIVAHVHNNPQKLLAALEKVDEKRDDGYEQALAKLFSTNNYQAVPYEGLWQAIKYPWHLLSLLELLLGEIKGLMIHRSADIHKTAVITGDVIIDEGTRVMAHAVISGPCYIGKHCIVANNALVRGSSIGDHSVVGYCTEAKGSVWHSHVWTHMTYTGDSIVGENVSFGAGSVTGNFRLDEKPIDSFVNGEKIPTHLTKFGAVIGNDCRLGIHVTIDPGVKIGAGSFISSATHVPSDIADGMFLRGDKDAVPNRETPPKPEDRQQYRKRL